MDVYERPKILSVDFDKTIARPVKFPYGLKVTWLNRLVWLYIRFMKRRGYIIVLNTLREPEKGLYYATNFCKQNNIPIDYANENLPSEIERWGESRKIACTYSIDDTQIGLIGWLLRRFG